MKKVAFLSCGRSDYGIYLPLIECLAKNKKVELTMIAFGSHPLSQFGSTYKQINLEHFKSFHLVDHLDKKDDPAGIAKSMSNCIDKLSLIYNKNYFDYLIALGDRYEMFSAVAASIPFNLKIIHLHGGEKTLGAIDDVFRHSITCMSHMHFTTCADHSIRVKQLTGKNENIHNVGSISLHKNYKKHSKESFFKELGCHEIRDFILVTIHPETINLDANEGLGNETLEALSQLTELKIITLPNNDTNNSDLRNLIKRKVKNDKNFMLVDSLGPELYFSALEHCICLVGNSSSGIIESAKFNKYAINIGDRQKGRAHNKNLINVPIDSEKIKTAILKCIRRGEYRGKDKFFNKNCLKIIEKEIIR